jgi:hypothetical protein
MLKVQHVYTDTPWSLESADQIDRRLGFDIYISSSRHYNYVIVQRRAALEDYKFMHNQKFKALRELVKLKHEYIRNYIESNNLQFLET